MNHQTSKSKKLHLHNFHLKQSAKFTAFAGWEMPVSYGSAMEEHLHTRKKASLFDVSHMGELRVSGTGAIAFLDHVLTNKISHIEAGKAVYSPFCHENGGTVDDLIVYKKNHSDFLLCVNASNIEKDFDHFLSHSVGFDCEIENVSNSYGQLALQGPLSQKILSNVTNFDFSNLKKMFFIEDDFKISSALISRTGYTGEDGFEIYCSINDIERWVHAFNIYLEKSDIMWCGLAARDSLRLEAGFPLYGHELTSFISPVQARLSWAINWNKGDFIGRASLLEEKNCNGPGRVCFYEVADRRIPREGCDIFFKDKKMGRVLSGGFSPTLQCPIGSAWIATEGLGYLKNMEWVAKLRSSHVGIKFEKAVLRKNKLSS
ncbi:MAG: glycine cleavage system aminomethyltransferase GcvT [Opitutae bacterium]|nr:glycine cleavage system aminomethyltransferase GcvT [Opitutae bacterium]